jgi:phosphoribosylformylglycinamidine synthase
MMKQINVFGKAISGRTKADMIALVARTSRSILRVMRVNVVVKPKEAVLDPQGAAVRDAMRHLGMPEVRGVRIGKYMEIDIEGEGADVEERLHGLCRDLLSNPVIEDYELQQNGPRKKATKKRGEKK